MKERQCPATPLFTETSRVQADPVGRFRLLSRGASFWVVAFTMFLIIFASAVPTPLYRVYQAEWHFSAVTVTAIFAVYALVLLAALLVVGRLSDYFGGRPVIIRGWRSARRRASCGGWRPGRARCMPRGPCRASAWDWPPGRSERPYSTLAAGSRLAGLLTSGSQMLGLAIGALGSAALVQYGPYPTGLVWWLMLAAFVAGILAVAVMPEPGGRRPGWLGSLRPQVRVPRAIGTTFIAALPSLIATWALSAFYLSLGPELAAQLLHSANLLWGGLAVFLLLGVGSVTAVAVAHIAPRACMVGGCLFLLAGAGLTLGAVAGSVSVLFLLGTAVAGIGFGPAWTGAYRLLVSDVAPGDRPAGGRDLHRRLPVVQRAGRDRAWPASTSGSATPRWSTAPRSPCSSRSRWP